MIKIRYFSILLVSLLSSLVLWGQTENNWVSQDLKWRNIGPANMMGRIAAVDALNTDYRHVVCATASGGVFKSTNGGLTWDPIFDGYGPGSIGSVVINQSNPDIIWVGTGESANRNSSGWGNGIYKSMDGGKTFQHMGLEDTHHIAEIALHPDNPNIAFAAAIGHLWGYSGDRGLFMTEDGGKSWNKMQAGLPEDPKVGCTEIIYQPGNPDVLFAGFYERLREPFWYQSGGTKGGLFKSSDGGKTWNKITNGLAKGASGQIDISISHKYPKEMAMAYEADENLPEGEPGSGMYKSNDGGETWNFLVKHAVRPFYHGQVEIDHLNTDTIYVVARGAILTYDGGKTWENRRWRADGGDDHDMWIAPYDSKIMYLCTDQGLKFSNDGGATWLSFNNMAIGQYYAINADMRDPYWVIGGLQDNGLWMGPSNSREYRGIMNMHNTWVGEGDGFYAAIDPEDYKTLYLVNHVGFAARVNFETREHEFITPTPETISNFKDHFDPNFEDEMIKYTIYPGEHWFFRDNPERPKLPPQFRFNWNSPLILSKHDNETIYFAGNYLFKSTDKGMSWKIISNDLTLNDPKRRNPTKSGGLTNSVTGGENYFTGVTISESPINPDEIWVGTDDGQIQLTIDGGKNWNNVRSNVPGIPAEVYVSRVEASSHKEGRAYITLDNHRYDDMKAYVYVTEDHGKTWKDISGNISDDWSSYVIREDPVNPELLFVGTETRVYASYSRGDEWHELMADIPQVAIYDLMIHPREGDLIAGTHGRSIWILDDISALREMNKEVANRDLHFFDSRQSTKWQSINTGRKQPAFEYRGDNPEYGALIQFYAKEQWSDTVEVMIEDTYHGHSTSFSRPAKSGINRMYWNFRFDITVAQISEYKNHLSKVVDQLNDRVIKSKKAQLKDISKKIDGARSPRQLNALRGELVNAFAGYALGEEFFGPKLMPFEAEDGKYKVRIKLGDKEVSGWVDIRLDPLVVGEQ